MSLVSANLTETVGVSSRFTGVAGVAAVGAGVAQMAGRTRRGMSARRGTNMARMRELVKVKVGMGTR